MLDGKVIRRRGSVRDRMTRKAEQREESGQRVSSPEQSSLLEIEMGEG